MSLNIQKIAKYEGQSKNYREILDLLKQGLKQGKVPISLEYYNMNRKNIINKFSAYLPAASDIHGSYAPLGVSFKDASNKYESRYNGYHVSEDDHTGEKILFPLAKTLPDAMGNEINVLSAIDHIILIKLDAADGKPALEYDHDAKKNETLVSVNASQTITPFPTNNCWVEVKNGAFVVNQYSEVHANYLIRDEEKNWNGIFFPRITTYILPDNHREDVRTLIACFGPSYKLGVLGKVQSAEQMQAEVTHVLDEMQANKGNHEKLCELNKQLNELLQKQ